MTALHSKKPAVQFRIGVQV